MLLALLGFAGCEPEEEQMTVAYGPPSDNYTVRAGTAAEKSASETGTNAADADEMKSGK